MAASDPNQPALQQTFMIAPHDFVDDAVANFFYVADTSFNAANTTAFKEMAAALKRAPNGYKINHKRLGGDLLERASVTIYF